MFNHGQKGDFEMREYIEAKIKELKKISNPENYLKNMTYNDVELGRKWRKDQRKTANAGRILTRMKMSLI